LAINQDIVLVCGVENIKVWVKGSVDISLECYSYIYKFKGYDWEFKEAIAGAYGCFSDNLISYPDEARSIVNVNFGNIIRFGLPG
jgi:hypothetical protein